MIINYDVAIIGAGPAGMFAAYHILKKNSGASILLIDQGKSFSDRKCCGKCSVCAYRKCCNILCGVGGSGLFSDGKLVLDLHSGGKLDSITKLDDRDRANLLEEIVSTLKQYDGKSEPSGELSEKNSVEWDEKCNVVGLNIKHYDVLHIGSENLSHIISNWGQEMFNNPHMTLKTNCHIVQVNKIDNGKTELYSIDGEVYSASHVIFAVGKSGDNWLHDIFSKNGIGFKKTNTYIGVRVETNHNNLKRLFDYSFDPKIWAFYGKRKVKTHCFCRHGNIISTYYLGIPVIGGYTQFTSKNGIPEKEQSPNSNFNILISTDRSKDEIMKILKQFKAINPDGGVFQKLSDFMATTDYEISQSGCFFNQCKHGNIRLILDRLDSSGSIIADFLSRLSKIVPGILEGDSIVYAPAVEWFMDSVEVDSHMETTQTNWFAVGDGAGLSQGIVHAAATSIMAAEEICKRLEAKTF